MPFLYRLASLLIALLVLPVQAAEMRVALLRTSGVETLDALTVDGGSWVRRVPLSHTAVLIEHHAATLLFDTGLGRDIDAQFRADMPWAAPLFAYQKVAPARDQLDAAGIRVDRILLSHAHWDHASGLVDFPKYRSGHPTRRSPSAASPPRRPPSPANSAMACAGDLTASIRSRSWASTKASTCLATAAWCWSPARPYARLGRSVRHPRQRAPAVLQRRHQLATRRRRRPTAEVLRRPRPGRSRSRAHPRATGEDPPAAPQRPTLERDSGARCAGPGRPGLLPALAGIAGKPVQTGFVPIRGHPRLMSNSGRLPVVLK